MLEHARDVAARLPFTQPARRGTAGGRLPLTRGRCRSPSSVLHIRRGSGQPTPTRSADLARSL